MSLEELRGILLTERESGKVTPLPPHLFEQTHEEIKQFQSQVYATEDPFSPESQMLIEKVASIRVTIEEIFSIRSSKIVSLAQSHADGSFIDREELKLLHPDELSMFHQVVEAIRICRSALIDQKITHPSPDLSTALSSTVAHPAPFQSSPPSNYTPVMPDSAPTSSAHVEPEAMSSSFSPECGTTDHFNLGDSLNESDLRDEVDSVSLTFDEVLQSQVSSSLSDVSDQLDAEEEGHVMPEEQEIIENSSDSRAYSLVLVVADMEPFMGVDGYVYEIRNGDVITLPRRNADVLIERNIVLNIKSN